MKLNDSADPSRVSELADRIETMKQALHEIQGQERLRKKLLGKITYQVSLINKDSSNNELWQTLAANVDRLVGSGLPPSNRELRAAIIPIIDQLPEFLELPQGFQLVLRDIRRFMASCPSCETAIGHTAN